MTPNPPPRADAAAALAARVTNEAIERILAESERRLAAIAALLRRCERGAEG